MFRILGLPVKGSERGAKIPELLQASNISSMDDIQNLIEGSIAECMEMGWILN